jgi:hypothetical protein
LAHIRYPKDDSKLGHNLGKTLLIDMEKDPALMENLVGRPEHAGVVARLSALVRAHADPATPP